MSFARFGGLIGTNAQTVFRWCLPLGHKDHRFPRGEMVHKVHRATGGAVDANALMQLPASAPPGAATDAPEDGR